MAIVSWALESSSRQHRDHKSCGKRGNSETPLGINASGGHGLVHLAERGCVIRRHHPYRYAN